jgi:predicted SAM-dependent methyltransferase
MATVEKPPTVKKKRAPQGMKLDLGCGQRTTEGFKGVDIMDGDGVDFVVDLFQYPWPFEDRSVREVVSNHVIEHIPHYRPEYGGVDGFWMFFNELHRICQRNAKVTISCPYAKADRGFWDPSHTRYIHEMNFYYLSPEWRQAQGLDHYPVTANFEVVTIDGLGVPDDIQNRNLELQAQARSYYWNVVTDLVVHLKAVK